MMRRTTHLALLGGAGAILALTVGPDRPPANAAVATPTTGELGCAVAADQPLVHAGDSLDTISLERNGVNFNALQHNMTLMRTGGSILEVDAPVTDLLTMGCAADFNEDGYDDIIGTTALGTVKIYLNQTGTEAAPDWTIANILRTPLFANGVTVDSNTTAKGLGSMACGDVDNDGFADAVLMRCSSLLATNCNGPDRHTIYYGNGIGGVRETRTLLKSSNTGRLYQKGNRMALHDVSGDGRPDLIMGQVDGGGGRVVAVIATTNLDKRFDNVVELFDDVGYASLGGVTSLAVADFTNDGKTDIAVGNAAESVVKLFTGSGGTTFANTGISIATNAFPVSLSAGNFALAGRQDLVVVNGNLLGGVRLYENDGDSSPFSGGTFTSLRSLVGALLFLGGFPMAYDGDPDNALDFFALGSGLSNLTFANRRNAGNFIDCGSVTSQNIESPELAGREAVVTQIKLTPTPAAPTVGTWSFQGSNDGETWHDAIPCNDDPTKYCVDFTTTSGSNIQWKLTMCSNDALSQAPTLEAVTTEFTYVAAANHFRAGPIARDGIIYVGAFREPGNDGRFMAIEDETQQVLWEASTKLDATAESARKIYAVGSDAAIHPLTTANASLFSTPLVAADVTQAQAVITWLRGKRFGASSTNKHALGGIVNSTAALLSEPGLPYWYNIASTTSGDKSAIEAHVSAYADRKQLLLVGARDGMVHAFHTDPLAPAATTNGTEAWAFVPPSVMDNLVFDYTNNSATAWPDGSGTLATAKINGVYKSVLVMGEGNGGSSVFALDVTETVQTNGTVVGPTLLWTFNDANMGLTSSKPVVIRTKIGTTETWLAVFSSGKGASGDVGDSVYAVDMTTGALVWRFDLGDDSTYVSSDITATDEDSAAPDGYISRLFFGDNKGRLWKLDPSAPSGGVVNAIGSITIDEGASDPDPVTAQALFSTRQTTGALGEDRGISGTLIAVPDSGTNRVVLYFGTGGTPETSTTAQNEFYAVYGDTGDIRTKMTPAAGVRFFGSATYNSGQIVFTRGEDVSSVDPCTPTSGEIVAIDAATFSEQFVLETNGTITAPMFASGGEIFVLTLSGKMVASQYTGVKNAVSSPSNGNGGGQMAQPDAYGEVQTPFILLSWKQVY